MQYNLALGFAAQAWCPPTVSDREMDPPLASAAASVIKPLLSTIETAWGIIANVNWEQQSPEWRAAAERWRDTQWHVILSGRLPKEST